MTIFSINYDLRKPGRDYASLIRTIESLGDTIHPQKSCWFVQTSLSSVQVRDALTQHIDSNDILFVMRANGDWAAYNQPQLSEWLKVRQRALA